ncbi:hypothetical protein DFR49_3248 [Hephaestia caeni]|jgi:hypothetical protein|uniref:Metal-binding protein n=2 Tax=Sphingomonadaceae TaxID=41297 RepID=A0A397NUH7_9SPHN|nr:DUF411 domain-containing protein [Hephaestia caeni]RIA37364.1 hypothetical protein DFR49_3248 [Hephaestia caeni]
MRTIRMVATALALALPAVAMATEPIVVHRDPGCGCCEEWAKQVKVQFKRDLRMVDDSNRARLKTRLGVPAALSSCHTAIIDGMAFEGHVPIADMKRALATRPAGVKGLAVGGMPIGSPGMEVPGMKGQPYSVVAFGPSGQKIFARY